jgi:hypothetical protein
MNDDWRLRVRLSEPSHAAALTERLDAARVEHELETAFADRVIVSIDDSEVFCYAGSRAQAQAAERLIRGLAAQHGWQITTELMRWHPEAEAWEDPELPLPDTPRELEAEHAERISRERVEAREQGYADFEVRVECRSERECTAFSERLRDEGLAVVRRGRYLVVGAADEDAADALAARIGREAPEGSSVVAEGTLPAVLKGSPMNPFAVFGGLGV